MDRTFACSCCTPFPTTLPPLRLSLFCLNPCHHSTPAGKTDVWLSLCDATKKWDICAPDALLAASGGRLSDAAGRPYRYTVDAALPNAAGLVGLADAAKHAEVIAAIAPAIAPYPYDVAP